LPVFKYSKGIIPKYIPFCVLDSTNSNALFPLSLTIIFAPLRGSQIGSVTLVVVERIIV
jgi:hypothetical protein